MVNTIRLTGAVAVALLVAGCSSSKKSDSAATTGTSTSTSTSASTSVSASASPSESSLDPASKARLQSMVLHASDLPKGWTSSPYEPDPSKDESDASFHACLGVENTDKDQAQSADSDDFSLDNFQISSSATSYKHQSSIDVDTATLTSPKIPTCFEKLMKETLAADPSMKGATIDSVTFKVSPRSSSDPENLAGIGHGEITMSGNGQKITIYEDIAFITGPQIEAEIDFTGAGTPVPAQVQAALIAKVAPRVAQG